MIITVFTPTFNRAYILTELYNSLCAQTNVGFEWLIVDDGSTDDTKEIIKTFIKENKIDVKYHYQCNGGKHRAINSGVQMAQGELFFIVDSDDFLAPNAIERIMHHYELIKDDQSFGGLSGVRAYFNGTKIGGDVDFTILDCNLLDLRYKHNVRGDLAEIYRTDILKEFPFPDVEGEKFCPEALVWYQIARKYRLRFFNEKIYFCEYLPDGLTAKMLKIRMNSPIASVMTYTEVFKSKVPFKIKIKSAILYWRFYFCLSKEHNISISDIGYKVLVVLPLGYILHFIDSKKT